jgi:hypothetical protein
MMDRMLSMGIVPRPHFLTQLSRRTPLAGKLRVVVAKLRPLRLIGLVPVEPKLDRTGAETDTDVEQKIRKH